jgi:hypothetical protein
MKNTRRVLLAPAVLAGAIALGGSDQTAHVHKANQKPTPAPNPTQAATYDTNGAPLATGAPRRLSFLAASDHRVSSGAREPLHSKRKAARPPR